ncbi:hypothetical protein ABPG73_011071 [Tetrahymena malaccensis]
MREGANIRGEMFSDTYRRSILSELMILKNKQDDDDDRPEYSESSELGYNNNKQKYQVSDTNSFNQQKSDLDNKKSGNNYNQSPNILQFEDSTFLERDDSQSSYDSSSSSNSDNDAANHLNYEGTHQQMQEESIYDRTNVLNFSKYQYSYYNRKSNNTGQNHNNLINDNKQGQLRQDSMLCLQQNHSNLVNGQASEQIPQSELDLKVGQVNLQQNMILSGQSRRMINNQDSSSQHLKFGINQGNNTSYDYGSQMQKSQELTLGLAQLKQQSLNLFSKDASIKNTNKYSVQKFQEHKRVSNITGSRKKKHQVKNYLSIMCYVKRFTNILKTVSTAYKFRSMSKKNFEIIGDLSSNYRFYKLSQYLQQDEPNWYEKFWYTLKKLCRTLIWNPINELNCTKFLIVSFQNRIQVIQPESTFKQYWDFFSNIFFIVNIFYIPVRVSFDFTHIDYPSMPITFVLYYLPPILLIIEMILKLNTAIYKQGMTTTNRSQIFYHYMRSEFFIDFIICFTQILSILLNIVELKSFIIFRYKQVSKVLNQMEERLNLNEQQSAYLNLFKLVFMIVFIAHICGCSFYLVTKIERFYGLTGLWTEKMEITNYTILQQYITSLYWAVITMITLGYGDITPQNTTERAFVILITMISCGTFAYSINIIGQIVQQIGKKENEQRKQINMLMSLMKNRGLTNLQLLMKIRRNFQYLLDQDYENNQEGVKFLQQIDPNLKNEVMRDIYGKILSKKKILQLNFSQNLIESLCLKLKEQTFGPEDIIINENEQVKSIYFIMSGEAQGYINVSSKFKKSETTSLTDNTISVLSKYSKGDIFGEKAFFSSQLSEYGVKAKTIVTVAYLRIDDFVECLKEREEDFEKFCLLRDKLQIYNISKGLEIKCFGCGQFTHTIVNCPHSKYNPDYDKILFLNNREVFQERQQYKRTKQRSGNTISISDEIYSQGVKFMMDYFSIETLQKYFEEKELAQLGNLNKQQYNEALLLQQNQMNAQLDNFGYVGSSNPNNSPALKQQQLKMLQQQMNQKDSDYIISPEQIISQQNFIINAKNQSNEQKSRELSVIQDEVEKSQLPSDIEDYNRERGASSSIQKFSSSRFQNELIKYELQQQQQQQIQQQYQPLQQQFSQPQQIIQLTKQVKPISLKRIDSNDQSEQQNNYFSYYDQNIYSYLTPKNSNKSTGNVYTQMKGQPNSLLSQFALNQESNASNFRSSISNTPSNNPNMIKGAVHRDSILMDKEKMSYLQPRQIRNITIEQKDDSENDEHENKNLKKRMSQSAVSNNANLSPDLTSIDNQRSNRLRDSSSQWNTKKSVVNFQTINQNWLDKNQFFTINGFDLSKQYKIYFPNNNQTKVIQHYTLKVMKKLQKQNQQSINNKEDIQKIIKSYQSTLLKSPKKRNQTLMDKKSIFTIYKSEGLLKKKDTDLEQSQIKNLDQSFKQNSSLNHVTNLLESQAVNMDRSEQKHNNNNNGRNKKFNALENNRYLVNQQKLVIKELNFKTHQIFQLTNEIVNKSFQILSQQNIQSITRLQDKNNDIQNYQINHIN